MAVSVGVGVGSDAGDPEPDTLDRPSAGDLSEESEEHDVTAANTTATTTATTAVDDLLRIMVAMEPRPDRDPSPIPPGQARRQDARRGDVRQRAVSNAHLDTRYWTNKDPPHRAQHLPATTVRLRSVDNRIDWSKTHRHLVE